MGYLTPLPTHRPELSRPNGSCWYGCSDASGKPPADGVTGCQADPAGVQGPACSVTGTSPKRHERTVEARQLYPARR
jgi:hypothetical protein